ncbi:hypothetical protein M408DRAFT_326110 [Serendipita vermifera MAFF 305830]|uniref:HPt domain-containing protein n=1 Tax=Serendipita vermifera MAFF 305830 TaxID=933852 RepID=A0A0C3BPL0_SERVB|nr:hypothetical protein M408DRAFT_326110 [Serendipita vermifera MAFF 305830]
MSLTEKRRDQMFQNQTMIDKEVFIQLIELDEDGSTEFLEGVAEEWFNQAEETLASMDDALKEKELDKFSKLAHFLKGSSGQLGVTTLQHSCTKLQHLGEQWDDEDESSKKMDLSEEEAIKRIKPILSRAKKEYKTAEKWLNDYLNANSDEDEDAPEDLQTPKAEVTQKEKDLSAKNDKKAVETAKVPVKVKS